METSRVYHVQIYEGGFGELLEQHLVYDLFGLDDLVREALVRNNKADVVRIHRLYVPMALTESLRATEAYLDKRDEPGMFDSRRSLEVDCTVREEGFPRESRVVSMKLPKGWYTFGYYGLLKKLTDDLENQGFGHLERVCDINLAKLSWEETEVLEAMNDPEGW
jgi:hypothetical protein